MEYPRFIQAPAKINLTLDVLGKRPDGYHDLASVMVAVALWDTLALWPRPDGIFTVTCDQAALASDQNLAVRAARLIAAHTGCPRGIHIDLRKVIPTQGGLGGGSSDAAAVLLALNDAWELRLKTATLIELATQLGSDVPFFIAGGTALVEGRGERVTPLRDLLPQWLVIVKPAVAVPTPVVFRALTATEWTDGAATRALVGRIQGGLGPEWSEATLINALEGPAMRQFPAIAAVRDALQRAGAACIRMSGSGPTLFAPCTTLAQAEKLREAAQAVGAQSWVAYPLSANLSPA